ncbi:hypothetical protein BSKO_08062 [Bryopsis sp. KO-2023]|nr:hypothetical protein BSKO_08062 [Bryopsis sp. KO-2023]
MASGRHSGTPASWFVACLLFASVATQVCGAIHDSHESSRHLLQKKKNDEKDATKEKMTEDKMEDMDIEMEVTDEPEAEAPGPEPEIIEKLCSGEVVFFIDAKFNWTADRHPVDYPKNAHWSPMYGAVHNDLYEMYSFGKNASKAVEEVAEKGTARLLKREVEDCIDEGNCREFLEFGCDEKSGDCRMEGNFTVNSTFSYVSFISMAVPSPDWFTGIASLNLCNDGAWLPGVDIPLNASDAGTDSGSTFTAKDMNIKVKDRLNITELDELNTTNPFYDPDYVPVEVEGEEEAAAEGEEVIGRLAEVVSFSLTQDAETAELDVSGTGGAVAITIDTDDLSDEELKDLAKEEAKIRVVGPDPENGAHRRSAYFWAVAVVVISASWMAILT